jgi:class 3 adenylate cyclase/tetratricopeptide (TPR) repeat protein
MQRKTVTVLFCDVTGSTSLGESVDPEALRGVLARYFERMKEIVERHGGTVEKFIGDAVMAVFGVPVAHEDDALRAVRAAVDMRDALPGLGIQARIGVNTGEVVTGTEERLATGDAVNVAARFEQAAPPGEILIGAPTLALLRDAAEVEEVEPLELKGKAAPVAAYRLLNVRETVERRHEARFVGRERELALLRAAWERAQVEQRCELVTIAADAGVGKSRLVAEALASLDVRVARGRCLPYGEAITYWPVVEILKQLNVSPTDEAVATAIDSLLRQTETQTSPEEIAWGVRKTLEQAAPLAVVFDDVHWGEETLLDLIEHVALLSSGAPILLLCMARPELLDRRPTWPVDFRLEPLGEADVDELIPRQITGEQRDKIVRAAGGNPLFIGEMLAMTNEADREVAVPPTLQALLAARLDRLDLPERGVLERGAVEGEIFHRGAVQALAPDEPQVTPRLASLVRKELIRPDEAQIAGDDGFRFRHLLIRDAAYDALPKAVRADLHERFAAWLERRGAALVEIDEVLGYHLEQACNYRRELGLDVAAELLAAGRWRLAAAARRAWLRQDHSAVARLLERAARLVPEGEVDLDIELDLLDALVWVDRGREAVRRARANEEHATATGDLIGELCARIEEGVIRTSFEPEGVTEELAVLLDQALPIFEAAGHDRALYTAHRALGQVANMRAQMDTALAAFERAALHARRAGMPNRLVGWRNMAQFAGMTPVAEQLAWYDELDTRDRRSYPVRSRHAEALAMVGRFAEARALLAELHAELVERGVGSAIAATVGESEMQVEFLAGNPAAAVEAGGRVCTLLDAMGESAHLSTVAGELALACCELGRLEDAARWADRAAELGSSDDAVTQVLWRQARAKVVARRGELVEAERVAREAIAIGESTQMLDTPAGSYAALAEVLTLAGRPAEATEALGEALARFERKGNLVMAERMRDRLAELR